MYCRFPKEKKSNHKKGYQVGVAGSNKQTTWSAKGSKRNTTGLCGWKGMGDGGGLVIGLKSEGNSDLHFHILLPGLHRTVEAAGGQCCAVCPT